MTELAASRNKLAARRVHIEVLRLIAIFFVIFIHTGKDGIGYYAYETNSTLRWLYLGISQIAYIAVPIFFMISGATLLGKEESKARIWTKRIPRFFLILLLFSCIYGVYNVTFCDWTMSFTDFLRMLYCEEALEPLWYLYSYIAFLMMLPLLRKMVQHMENSDFLYFGLIALIVSNGISTLEYLTFQGLYPINGHLKGALFSPTNIVYPIMGYYFEHVMPKSLRNWKVALAGILLSGASICMGAYLTLAKAGYHAAPVEETDRYFTLLSLIPTWTVYFCVKLFFDTVKIPQTLSRVLVYIGSTIFGVYLLEEICRRLTKFILFFLQQFLPSPIAALCWVFCAMLLGIGIVSILKKIPLIRSVF